MRRDKKRKTMQETLSSLDAVLAALDGYPDLEDALLNKAQGELNKYMGQLFPTQLDFAKDILEHLVGTDVLIDIVSSFLTLALPGVEISLKSVLLANMQNLGTNCTIDPFIYEKAIKEGILFDLRQIDLYDKLTVSPLDKKIGQYYYFGIDDCESSYDVLQSAIDPNNQTEERKEEWLKSKTKKNKDYDGPTQKEGTSYLNRAMNDSVGHYFGGRKRDFDCLLWYMKNKGINRQVWGKRTSEKESIFNGGSNIQGWINKKGNKHTVYYEITGQTFKTYVKEGYKGSAYDTTGSLTKMSTDNKEYKFKVKDTYYKYYYGNPPISKLSRKKFYYNEVESETYNIYYFKEDKWNLQVKRGLKNYQGIESIPTDEETLKGLKKGNFIVIDNALYYIKKDVNVQIVTKKDKDGNKHTESVINSIKTEECIDITESLKNDTCLYVDYDDIETEGEVKKTKGEHIKKGKTPTTSLPNTENKGKKQWTKVKLNVEEEDLTKIPKKSNECFYEDLDGDNKYTENVDKILIRPYNEDGMYVDVAKKMAKKSKYTKDFGVVTLEYSPRTGNVTQSDGNPMQQQTPYDNVLHVFFGNVKEIGSTECDAAENAWAESSNSNKEGQDALNTIQKFIKLHNKIWKRKKKEVKNTNIRLGYFNDEPVTNEDLINIRFDYALNFYKILIDGGDITSANLHYESGILGSYEGFDNINVLTAKIKEINQCLQKYEDILYSGDEEPEFNFEEFNTSFINDINNILKTDEVNHYYSIGAFARRIAQIMDKNESLFYLKSRNASYPEARKNYYLKRTLFEFNADYVNSLQLFDPKVLAAQLITSLFGATTVTAMVGMTSSWKTELINDIVKDMVQKQIASEDFAVSDCFFTFTNDAYNGMLRAADLRQAGLYSQHGEENGNNSIDPAKLLEGLNDFANCADQEGQTTIIKGAIMDAAAEVSKDIYKEDSGLLVNANYGIDKSFIDTLIINLCTQLVMAMLSPKVYLLILMNLEMFGLSTNFDLKAFLERFEALIRSIIKSVVDQFMQYLTQEIMKIVEELVQKLIKKLALEQVEMYARLIKQILMHLRMLSSCGESIGWSQDVPEYADIVNSESSQEPIDEC